jgi:hypothetical protein
MGGDAQALAITYGAGRDLKPRHQTHRAFDQLVRDMRESQREEQLAREALGSSEVVQGQVHPKEQAELPELSPKSKKKKAKREVVDAEEDGRSRYAYFTSEMFPLHLPAISRHSLAVCARAAIFSRLDRLTH